jgi:hypothetical protein
MTRKKAKNGRVQQAARLERKHPRASRGPAFGRDGLDARAFSPHPNDPETWRIGNATRLARTAGMRSRFATPAPTTKKKSPAS